MLGTGGRRNFTVRHSVFDSSYEGLAIGQQTGNFWIADKNYNLEDRQGDPSKLFALAKLDTPLSDKPEIQASLKKKLKAHIQWFTNGLAENNLYH